MEKDYLQSLEYGILAFASVGIFVSGIEMVKSKIKGYIKKMNC